MYCAASDPHVAGVESPPMALPEEFTPEAVAARSADAHAPYLEFVRSGEPYRSMFAANPWLIPPRPDEPLEWGTGRYYDTTEPGRAT